MTQQPNLSKKNKIIYLERYKAKNTIKLFNLACAKHLDKKKSPTPKIGNWG